MRIEHFVGAILGTMTVSAAVGAQEDPVAPVDAATEAAAPATDPETAPTEPEAQPEATTSTGGDAVAVATPALDPSTNVEGTTSTAPTTSGASSPPEQATEADVEATPERKFPSFHFYGRGRVDFAYATQRMAHLHSGFWVLSPSTTGGERNSNVPEAILYPRWSRLGVDVVAAEPEPDVQITAKIEIDFMGGGSESRATPRIRHAYGQIALGNLSILGGQFWDLIAPLEQGGGENGTFWYGGNLGDRRPQLRATLAPTFGTTQVVLAGAAVQSGAVDMADVDEDSVMDGVASARPAVQGLVELRLGATDAGKKPVRVGISGHSGSKRIRLDGVDEDFEVVAGIAHLEVPVSIFTLRAEGWVGENLRDLRGGIGQGIELRDTDGDSILDEGKEIPAKGGFFHVQVDPVKWYSAKVGAGVDNPKGIDPGGRGLNQTVDFTSIFKPYQQFVVGLVYDYYHTDYVGAATKDGDSHRVQAYTMVPF